MEYPFWCRAEARSADMRCITDLPSIEEAYRSPSDEMNGRDVRHHVVNGEGNLRVPDCRAEIKRFPRPPGCSAEG